VSADDDTVDNTSKHDSKQVIHSEYARFTDSVREISPEDGSSSTENGGKLNNCDAGHVDADVDELAPDMASGALASARAIASGKGVTAERVARAKRRRRSSGASRYSGARPDDRDPTVIGAILGKALPELGWIGPLATARLLGQWDTVVGADIAAHCQPVSLTDGDLKVTAESTAWATQLRLMAPRILAKITAELPPGMVKKIVITGPTGPSWKHGPWSVRGGRGVRDTYG
jgi:predicted nucleic acid-binding Zn ribbon protein